LLSYFAKPLMKLAYFRTVDAAPDSATSLSKRRSMKFFAIFCSGLLLTGACRADSPAIPDKNEVIKLLQLEHHFEGGYFRQTFKADQRDKISTARGPRSTLTTIYYMLTDDTPVDHFHTKSSDGIEYYHMGAPITYHLIYPDGRYEAVVVGPDIRHGQQLQLAVKGGTWKAAELTKGQYGLVSEAVAPGWEMEDMVTLTREELLKLFPQHKDVIIRLTRP
jgi:predicted cupin superfamily sugar epimerase